MIKLFKKLCLCGILLTSINYELVYSSQNVILRTIVTGAATAEDLVPAVQQLPLPDLTQFNPQLVINNEPVTDTTQLVLDSNKIISGNNILGEYDTSKFYVEDNTLYEKDKVFCVLNPDAGDYGVFSENCSYTSEITYKGNNYIVFPISNIVGQYFNMSSTLTKILPSNEYIDVMLSDTCVKPLSRNNITLLNNFCNSDINIMCVQIAPTYPNSKYKLSSDNLKITYNSPLAKYDSETQKWYGTDGLGNFLIKDGTENEKIELNKVILNIPSNRTLTIQETEEPVGGGGHLLSSN